MPINDSIWRQFDPRNSSVWRLTLGFAVIMAVMLALTVVLIYQLLLGEQISLLLTGVFGYIFARRHLRRVHYFNNTAEQVQMAIYRHVLNTIKKAMSLTA